MAADRALRGVLVDLDGTLVDSLPALRLAYDRFLAAHGAEGDDREFAAWNGPPLREVVVGLAARHGIPGDPRQLTGDYLALVEAAYGEAAVPAPGARELLEWLAVKGLRTAVVTSAPADLARALLARHGLATLLAAIVGGTDVERGKPAPDPYLVALQRLGVTAEAAVAVEDSPSGVRSALAAGLPCLGVGPLGPALLEVGAAAVACGLDGVQELLAALATGPGRICAGARLAVRATGVISTLDSPTEDAVERVWKEERLARPELTDGELLSVTAWRLERSDIQVDVAPTRYRRFLARRRGLPVNVRPLGVTAVTLLAAPGQPPRVAVGRRGPGVTQYPGRWELVPSGSVDRARIRPEGTVDVGGQLLAELAEELGIAAESVRELRPLGLVEDLRDGVIDLVFLAEVEGPGAPPRGAEHDVIRLLPEGEVGRLATGASDEVVPTLGPALRLLALLRADGRAGALNAPPGPFD